MSDHQVKIDIQTRATGDGTQKSADGLKQIRTESTKTDGAYTRLGKGMQSAMRNALGPITAIIGALALLRRGVASLNDLLTGTASRQRAIQADNAAAAVQSITAAYERMARAITAADAARAALTQRDDAALQATRQLESAQFDLERAQALAALSPDDAPGRARTEARFGIRAAEMGRRHGSQDIHTQRQRLEAEAQARRAEAAEADEQAQRVRVRIPGALQAAETESARRLSRRTRASEAIPMLDIADHDATRAQQLAQAVQGLQERYAALLERRNAALAAAQAADDAAAPLATRAQAVDLAGQAAATTGASTLRTIDHQESQRRQAERRAAALEAGRATLGPEVDAAKGRIDILQSRHDAAAGAARDPDARPTARRAAQQDLAQITRQLSQAHQSLRELQALLADEAALIQQFAQDTAAHIRQTTNALKRNDA